MMRVPLIVAAVGMAGCAGTQRAGAPADPHLDQYAGLSAIENRSTETNLSNTPWAGPNLEPTRAQALSFNRRDEVIAGL